MALYWGAVGGGWILSGEAAALIAAGGMALLALLGTYMGEQGDCGGAQTSENEDLCYLLN